MKHHLLWILMGVCASCQEVAPSADAEKNALSDLRNGISAQANSNIVHQEGQHLGFSTQHTRLASNTKEILEAIQPNTTIVIPSGVYIWDGQLQELQTKLSQTDKVILKAEDAERPPQWVSKDRDRPFLILDGASNLCFDHIWMSYRTDTTGNGGILKLSNTSNIHLWDCRLDGPCGYGIIANNITHLDLQRIQLHRTQKAMLHLADSKKIYIKDSEFSDNTSPTHFMQFERTNEVEMTGLFWIGNKSSLNEKKKGNTQSLFFAKNCNNIILKNSQFTGCSASYFHTHLGLPMQTQNLEFELDDFPKNTFFTDHTLALQGS